MQIKNYTELFNDESFKMAAEANRICLFIGAGVAHNLKMPNWKNLANEIVKYCLQTRIINHSFAKTLESIEDPLKTISFCIKETEIKNKNKKLNELLSKIFVKNPKNEYLNSKKDDNNIYKNLIEICCEQKALIVQTNYDNIIENEISNNTKFELVPYVPFLDEPVGELKNCLIYLHGKMKAENKGILSYNNLILTRQQYNDVYVIEQSKNEKYSKQNSFFNQLLNEYFIIFLGYSLQDIELLHLIANKKKTESYKKLAIVVDTCDIKKPLNKIDAEYLYEASNKQVLTYSYSTEKKGFKSFEVVVKNLKKTLFEYPKKDPITVFQNPEEVIF